ncbi:MAG TPA: RNA polymerase sigma factor [Cyclobacteriaceae bacterium]|jgi:RNA polymerase sigma-70 factor (ECF subfamily)|nr:RNA polymerase sigma factor [Cyclobacteriaceae bacterium]
MKTNEFERELANLRPTLLEFTRKFTNNRDDSMDLLQDTMLKALSRKTKFREDINLKGWLYILMRNLFINQYRKNKTIGQRVDESYLNWTEDTHTFNRPDGITQTKEVWKIIDSIKIEFNKPFKMYLSGYKYQEIAKELGVPIGTVKSRIFQARIEIQNQLIGYR